MHETQKDVSILSCIPEMPANPVSTYNLPQGCLYAPTWEYVCWLEEKLSKYIPNPLLEAEYPVATSDPFLAELRKAFPDHTFEYDYDFVSHRDNLLIDGLIVTLKWTHPDETYLNAMSGEVPDQFATTEDYLKHEILKQVAEYLTHKGEKNERV